MSFEKSRQLHERSARSLAGGVSSNIRLGEKPTPLFFERGDGCRVTDVDGREFLDCANHHTAQILGHNHPAVSEAINRQVGRGVVLGGPTGGETELAEEMCGRVESLERILLYLPRDAKAHLELGHVHRKYEQHDRALEAYRTALSIRPGFRDAQQALTEALEVTEAL